jgi:hypothetical protein
MDRREIRDNQPLGVTRDLIRQEPSRYGDRSRRAECRYRRTRRPNRAERRLRVKQINEAPRVQEPFYQGRVELGRRNQQP